MIIRTKIGLLDDDTYWSYNNFLNTIKNEAFHDSLINWSTYSAKEFSHDLHLVIECIKHFSGVNSNMLKGALTNMDEIKNLADPSLDFKDILANLDAAGFKYIITNENIDY